MKRLFLVLFLAVCSFGSLTAYAESVRLVTSATNAWVEFSGVRFLSGASALAYDVPVGTLVSYGSAVSNGCVTVASGHSYGLYYGDGPSGGWVVQDESSRTTFWFLAGFTFTMVFGLTGSGARYVRKTIVDGWEREG